MNVFTLRSQVAEDYAGYITSFHKIRDERISELVNGELVKGRLWPKPLVQLNPCFRPGATVDELVKEKILHEECGRIFRRKKDDGISLPLRLHAHQENAIRRGVDGKSYVLTTGTGSGKSMTYIIPIVDHVLKQGSCKRIKAIVHEMISPDADAAITIGARGLQPNISNASTSGTTLKTCARVLAYDFACLVASLTGMGNLPRFWIHDIPRAADTEDTLYHRIMHIAATLESQFEEPEPAYQPIWTTTTQPPNDLCGVDQPYVRHRLHARSEDGLLLKRRLS